MKQVSRRSFLSDAAGSLGSGWLASRWPAFLAAAAVACERRDSGSGFAYLDTQLADTLGAVAEQILPEDDTPGARDLGVVWFIDALLGGTWSGIRPLLEAGARALDQRAGSNERFADLPFENQTTIVEEFQGEPFFSLMRLLTLGGVFSMPARGGNREKAGWAMIGFEDQHSWAPPFGQYELTDLETQGEPEETG